MNADALLAALDLPASCCIDRRVPKKLLIEHAAQTTADKRRIIKGIKEVRWLAALKPTTIGVPEFCNATREYLEIAILSTMLCEDAQGERLTELLHRAIPYPVFLITSQGNTASVSLTHKRWSQGERGAIVLDGEPVLAELGARQDVGIVQAFERALSIALQPRANLYSLYQGWMDTVVALIAARFTGVFTPAGLPHQIASRREAIHECARLESKIACLRVAAAKERQMPRQVKLNLELKRLKEEYSSMLRKL